MAYYPIFLDMTGRACLVVGGGRIGLEKVRGLLAAGAAITVISPILDAALQLLVDDDQVNHLARNYAAGDMEGYEIVMVASDDRSANAVIHAEGRARGIWVNSADDAKNCDFILPSVVRRGSITIGISTGGGSPAMARRVREELTDYFTEDFEGLAELLAEVRAELKTRHVLRQIDQETWQRAIDGPLRALIAQRRRGQAKTRLLSALGAPLVPPALPEARPPTVVESTVGAPVEPLP